MTSRPSRFPAAAQRRQPAQLGSGLVAMIVASLFAAAVFFQPPAHSAGTTFAGLAAEEAAVVRSSDGANNIAELEKQFWVCDYLGTSEGSRGRTPLPAARTTRKLKQANLVAILKSWSRGGGFTRSRNTRAGVHQLCAVLSTKHRCKPLI
jgi:hypothetical protein